MTRLQWHRPKDATFETGLDRGVLYPEDGAPVPWNGLISVESSGESEVKELYLDGIKYLSIVSARDWKGTLEAYTFPDEFSDMVGISEAGDGLYFDSQAPSRFCLSYRTMITAPDADTQQHYKIHLIYMATAVLGDVSHQTLSGEGVEPSSFTFELTAVPQSIPGWRPTAHVILDTREIDPITLGTLEGMLYGNGARNPEFPSITELTDMLTFTDTVTVVYNGDGTWTATGSNKNIQVDSDGYFVINNVLVSRPSPEIYVFLDAEAGANGVYYDIDGVPYYAEATGKSGIGFDTDGAPFADPAMDEALIYEDLDSIPYLENTEPPAPEPEEVWDGGTVTDPGFPKIIDGGGP